MRSGSCMTVKGMGGMAKYKGTQMREQQLTEMIEKKVMEAKEVCGGEPTFDECKGGRGMMAVVDQRLRARDNGGGSMAAMAMDQRRRWRGWRLREKEKEKE
ncbi:uncharacterized protein LOC132286115 [Cornus florida]|uniref:uncharacterized protein LOC132286115 n=1 Tax=Cornus florida TaxID=4283 RepID=UPI00289BA466|nr:uncharacterized protein LOC132286115 [Cornus florida]